MREPYTELKALIDYLQTVYTKLTEEWKEVSSVNFSMKRTTVADIYTDDVIYTNIQEYLQFLNSRSAAITFDFSFICRYNVTARVKAKNSIEYKLKNYMTDKHEHGKIPVNKCLNDLFGVRIFLEDRLEYSEINQFVQETYKGKYRCIDSSKLEYKATHIYFKENNESFPWELQIWNKEESKENFESHKRYKQEYTSWEKELKEGGINDDKALYNNE